MINLEQRFKNLYNTDGGKSARLIFYKKKYHNTVYPRTGLYPSYQLYPHQYEEDVVDFVIGDDMIHTDTLEITESLCSNENLDFGACEAAQFEIVVSGDKYIRPLYPRSGLYPHTGLFPAENLVGREFAFVESFVSIDDSYPHVGLYPRAGLVPSKSIVRGIFTVESIPKEDDRDTRRIIAYDRMNRFNIDVSDWYETMPFPITLKRFRAALCSYVGIPQVNTNLVNDDLIIEKTLDTETLNGRDLIRYICQINGVFGNINYNGEFRYVVIPKKDRITDTITIYKSVDSEEFIVPAIDKVKIRQEEADIGGSSTGEGNNFYIIEGNFLVFGKTTAQLNQIANKIRTVVTGLEYRPATIVGNAAPWYEMGDRIRIPTTDGDVNTIIMYRTSSGIQGPIDTIESTGSTELNQTFNIESQIIQTKGLVAKVKFTVEEVSTELINFEKETSTKFTQTAEKIELEAKRAIKAEGELSSRISLTAEEITAEVRRATKAEGELSARITITAEQISSEVIRAKDEETKLSSRITQTAESITTEVNRAKGEESRLSSRINQTATDISLEVTRATKAEGELSGKITVQADRITSEVNRATGAEGSLSSRITQTAEEINVKIANTNYALGSVSMDLSLTAESLTSEINRATAAENSIITQTSNMISTKVSKGDVCSEINQEAGQIKLFTNRLIIDSTNFKLDASGNPTFSGKITGGSINITGSKFAFSVNSSGVSLGDFEVNDRYGRNTFQSNDQVNGMSTGEVTSGKYYLWAGYGSGVYGIDSLFLVNTSQVHATHDFFLHGPDGTINVYDAIKSLQGGGGGDSCSSDSGCSSYSSCSSKTSCPDDSSSGCPIKGCVGLTCGPDDV